MLALILFRGPFGLGTLWKSERFDAGEKAFLTIVIVIYTLVLAGAFYYAAKAIADALRF